MPAAVQLPLVLILLAVTMATASPALQPASQRPLELVESVLRNSKVINLQDVIDRQLMHSLRTVRQERFVVQSANDLPPTLFATVTPCLSPVEVEFHKFSGGARGQKDSRMVQTQALEEDDYQRSASGTAASQSSSSSGSSHRLVGRRSITYKLDTSGARSLSLKLGAFSHSDAPLSSSLTHVKTILKLSNRYPNIELGHSRHSLQVCSPGGSPDLMHVRVDFPMGASARMQSVMRVCAVVNTRRRLNEYCAAQIGLNNSLPYPRQGLLDGVQQFVLPPGTYAYNCTDYSSLWPEGPLVNVSHVLQLDPEALYVNAYLVWPGNDGQAESVAWETSLYYRKDPRSGRSMPMVTCGQQFQVESSTGLRPVPGTANGVYEATVSIQMPPNTSLLVRPSRLEMVASAYSVDVTPYSGQSSSFAVYASNSSCSDMVWGYGGVVCGLNTLHTCLPGDGEVCRHDSFRVVIRLEHKIHSYQRGTGAPTRHQYNLNEAYQLMPHQVQWQYVHLANTERQDVVQPRIGRVEEAITLLKSLLESAKTNSKIVYKSVDGENSDSAEVVIRRHRTALKMCEVALKTKVFRKSSRHLIRDSVKCYKKLLQVHIQVVEQCSYNGHSANLSHPMRIQIASPITSLYTALYTPSVNSYLCLVFELSLSMEAHSRLRNMQARDPSMMTFTKAYRRFMSQLEIRLLSTVSTFELPTNENQGFKASRQDPAQLLPIRHQGGRQRRGLVESMHLIYRAQSNPSTELPPEFEPSVEQLPSLNRLDPAGPRVFAIYIYAMPMERLRRTKAVLSLFAFKLHSFSKRNAALYGCRKQKELREAWKSLRASRRRRKQRMGKSRRPRGRT